MSNGALPDFPTKEYNRMKHFLTAALSQARPEPGVNYRFEIFDGIKTVEVIVMQPEPVDPKFGVFGVIDPHYIKRPEETVKDNL